MSDDDWEAAAEQGTDDVPVVNRWAGEDEDDGVAESWDEDPEEKKKKAQAQAANKAPQGPVLSQRKKKLLEDEEKKRKEKEAADAETDPALAAARRAEETQRALKRDAALAASLLGVELSDDTAADQPTDAAAHERDAGNDIAAGGETVSVEELARIGRGGGGSLDDFDFTNDASVDKLAALLAKRATDLPSNARNSTRLLRFLKSLTDSICNPMKLDDVAELRRSITAKHNELTVKQKQQQKGKKSVAAAPGSKKANTVKVASSGGSAGRNTYGDELDDYGDDDDGFM